MQRENPQKTESANSDKNSDVTTDNSRRAAIKRLAILSVTVPIAATLIDMKENVTNAY